MPKKAKQPTLWKYFIRYKTLFFLGAIALFGTNILQLLVPKIFGWVIDALQSVQATPDIGEQSASPKIEAGLSRIVNSFFSPLEVWVKDVTLSAPVKIAFALLGIAVVAGLIRILSRTLIFWGGRRIEYDLRRTIFDHLLNLSPSFFRKSQTGDILSRASNDLTSVRLVFGPGILNIINTAISFASGLPLLIAISPSLALIALLPFPAILGISFFVVRRIFHANIRVQSKLAELSAYSEETLSGMSVVQAYSREDAFAKQFSSIGQTYIDASMGLVKTRGLMGPLIGSIGGLGIVIALYFGGKRVIAGEMSLGDLVAFQAYLALLAWPLTALGFVLSMFERGRAAFTRISYLLAQVPTLVDAKTPLKSPESSMIEIKDFSFSYGETQILKNISLKIPEGTSLGVVGPTGAGKSTLIMVLARLLEVEPGKIFLGGVDITKLSVEELRKRIALIPQDTFLFANSIAENLAFGIGGDTPENREKVIEAAKISKFWEEVEGFPEKLDTEIGERGVQLSGGQKQRASLARALVCDPNILILDDSLSAVDAHTESEILGKLPALSKGRITIIVSHRVAAVKHANQIIVLDHGRITEQGTHQELREQNGRYAEFERLQLLKEELGDMSPKESDPSFK